VKEPAAVRVLPVLDLKGGHVVHGIAGRRADYRPIVSRLTASADPRDVATAFLTQLGLRELYVADLDAIAGAPPALATFAALHALGCVLWVDAGLRTAAQGEPLLAAGVERIVAGLETLAGPEELARLSERSGESVVFSLDLKEGKPLSNAMAWGEDAFLIAARATTLGVRSVLVLDLARVGVGEGLGTEELCGRLASAFPQVEVLAGGGVRGPEDLHRLRQCGVRGVLVASALHDGRLSREDLRAFLGPEG
jgi:phosphoribosylformimino-5-aminoimidazole carboxamide ribotide isomerase